MSDTEKKAQDNAKNPPPSPPTTEYVKKSKEPALNQKKK